MFKNYSKIVDLCQKLWKIVVGGGGGGLRGSKFASNLVHASLASRYQVRTVLICTASTYTGMYLVSSRVTCALSTFH